MAGGSAATGFNISIGVMIASVLGLTGFAIFQMVRFARRIDAEDLLQGPPGPGGRPD